MLTVLWAGVMLLLVHNGQPRNELLQRLRYDGYVGALVGYRTYLSGDVMQADLNNAGIRSDCIDWLNSPGENAATQLQTPFCT